MRVHVLIWQFLDSSYKFLIMSVQMFLEFLRGVVNHASYRDGASVIS